MRLRNSSSSVLLLFSFGSELCGNTHSTNEMSEAQGLTITINHSQPDVLWDGAIGGIKGVIIRIFDILFSQKEFFFLPKCLFVRLVLFYIFVIVNKTNEKTNTNNVLVLFSIFSNFPKLSVALRPKCVTNI